MKRFAAAVMLLLAAVCGRAAEPTLAGSNNFTGPIVLSGNLANQSSAISGLLIGQENAPYLGYGVGIYGYNGNPSSGIPLQIDQLGLAGGGGVVMGGVALPGTWAELTVNGNIGVVGSVASTGFTNTSGTSGALIGYDANKGHASVAVGTGLLLSGGTLSATAVSGITMAQALVAISSNTPPFFAVTNWGLKGDGVTDNSLAFQGLLNIVATNSFGWNTNGIIWFPPGRFLFNTNIYLPKGTFVIQGCGAGSIVTTSVGAATMFDIRATNDLAWFMGTNLSSLVLENIQTYSQLGVATNSQYYFVNCNPQLDKDVFITGISNVAAIVLSTNATQTSAVYGGYVNHCQFSLTSTNIGVWLLTNANDFEVSFDYIKGNFATPEIIRVDGFQNDISHLRVECSVVLTNLFLVNGRNNTISFCIATDSSSLTSVCWFNGYGNWWLNNYEDSAAATVNNAFQGAYATENTIYDLTFGFHHNWNGLQYSLSQWSDWFYAATPGWIVQSNSMNFPAPYTLSVNIFTNGAGYVSQKSLNTDINVATNLAANGMTYWTNYSGYDGTLFIGPTTSAAITNIVLGANVLCGLTNTNSVVTIPLRQTEWAGVGRVSGTPVMVFQWR